MAPCSGSTPGVTSARRCEPSGGRTDDDPNRLAPRASRPRHRARGARGARLRGPEGRSALRAHRAREARRRRCTRARSARGASRCPARGAAAPPRPRAPLRRSGDLRRRALARRRLDRVPEAARRHAQRLGEARGRAVREGPPHHSRHEAPHPRLRLDVGLPVHPVRPGPGRRRELQRPRRRSGRPARPGGEGAARARPHGREGRARDDLRAAEGEAGHRLRRPERPRPGVARPLRGADCDRQAQAPAQERPALHELRVRPEGRLPARDAHHREGRHRAPGARRWEAAEDSTAAACSRSAPR